MEKQKRWQLFVILAVLFITLYNIFPTIIYYSKPLKQPIDDNRAEGIVNSIGERVNKLENHAIDWVHGMGTSLGVKIQEVVLNTKNPALVEVTFATKEGLDRFTQFAPVAGDNITFPPAQLAVYDVSIPQKKMTLIRNIDVHFDDAANKAMYNFAKKYDEEGKVLDGYFDIVQERFCAVGEALLGTSTLFSFANKAIENTKERKEFLEEISKKITIVARAFGEESQFFIRYVQSIFRGPTDIQRDGFFDKLHAAIQDEKKKNDSEIQEIVEKKQKNDLVDSSIIEQEEHLRSLNEKLQMLSDVLVKNKKVLFSSAYAVPQKTIQKWLDARRNQDPSRQAVFRYPIQTHNPFFEALVLDWDSDTLFIEQQKDLLKILQTEAKTEIERLQQEVLHTLLFSEIAEVRQKTEEDVAESTEGFRIPLYKLEGSSSFLALDLQKLSKTIATQTKQHIEDTWHPKNADLARSGLPIYSLDEYNQASSTEKRACMVVIPGDVLENEFQGLNKGAIYVVVRGFERMAAKYQDGASNELQEQFSQDFSYLARLLQRRGFIAYPGNILGSTNPLAKDFVFELNDYYSMLLKATRENFYAVGNKKHAVLEFTDVEQRILTENRIDDAIQEDLLRAKEAYTSAQVSLDPVRRLIVPPVQENVWLSNVKRSMKKYFRGDDSRIIRWGLDLSGGKSVRLALFDQNNLLVADKKDMEQAVNELYTRINKMGVSERTIRMENTTILVDFPGAQGISANELIKASSLYFHIVNERFGRYNKATFKEVNAFLQEVWNEAVVTNRQDIDSINAIAQEKLENAAKRIAKDGAKENAQILFEKGLRLGQTEAMTSRYTFDDTTSMIAKYRGDEMAFWRGQTHPLLVVFRNFALDGSSLDNVSAGYDQTKGNILYFGIKKHYAQKGLEDQSPQENFYRWTSQFSQDRVSGTEKEHYSAGHGWRMAAILNGEVVSDPALAQALKESAMISGGFSQREVDRLVSDLRAGSLTFVPKILSEQNISPELGDQERSGGIQSAIIGVIAVVVIMITYYRFSGFVASIAVLFNILVVWAVMQNIDAVLTLPGIAGIVLTVGMAVDANVLVFERIREEFRRLGKIGPAIQLGYERAFTAILDSNLTTILAALILIQFDSGPIKGFATTLIIGITASMFTALFVTKYIFIKWADNPKHTELKMAEWIRPTQFSFLKRSKQALVLSGVIFALGVFFFSQDYKSLFGMDFTGGYSLVVDLQEDAKGDYRDRAAEAFSEKGLNVKEYAICELGRDNLLRIQLSIALEEPHGVFYGLPQELDVESTYDYMKNPRIQWIIEALGEQGLSIKESQFPDLSNTWTSMSGQLSDTMQRNALYALGFSLLGILVYIALRFEWTYAVSAVLGLVHDVLIALSFFAAIHYFGAPVQIDLQIIGAIMTLIGYSLNDTIIVFDRIREDRLIMRNLPLATIIDRALNQTLGRTIMTSLTTFVVLLALLLLGGSSIFGFAFIMAIGVIVGTYSSLFIASYLFLYFEERSERHLPKYNK